MQSCLHSLHESSTKSASLISLKRYTYRRDRVLPSSPHDIQKLRIRQSLCFIRQEELAAANAPVFLQNWELGLQHVGIIANNNNMEPIVDVAARLFGARVIRLYDLDKASVFFSSGLCRESDDSRCATGHCTPGARLEVIGTFTS